MEKVIGAKWAKETNAILLKSWKGASIEVDFFVDSFVSLCFAATIQLTERRENQIKSDAASITRTMCAERVRNFFR